MNTRTRLRCALPVLALAVLAVPSDTSAQQPAQQPPNCSTGEHRQFDFWLGEWSVTDSTGQQQLGHNKISRILKDCVLLEEWTGASGNNGKSYNIYSRADRKWHQSWVSDTGAYLLLTGELRNGAMVLEGESIGPNGAKVQNRVTWSIVNGNRDHVRQFWQQSTDNGATWTVAFDGHYRRVKG